MLAHVIDENGCIRGTGVEAHRIAALVRGGVPASDILVDYPGLDAGQVEAAVAYARDNPWHGQPFPTETFKSVLRAGDGVLKRAFAAARSRPRSRG